MPSDVRRVRSQALQKGSDTEETSLRDLLRGGGSDAQIAARWADAMWVKPAAHGLNTDAFARPSRTMSRIGG